MKLLIYPFWFFAIGIVLTTVLSPILISKYYNDWWFLLGYFPMPAVLVIELMVLDFIIGKIDVHSNDED